MHRIKALVFAASMLLSFHLSAQLTGDQTYKIYCVGCHGKNLEGGLATPLVKTTWKYGREKKYILRSIGYGIPDTDMIAWKDVLSEDQIEAVADFIIERQDMPLLADREIPAKIESELYTINIEQIVPDGIAYPWSIEFIDNSTLIVSEISGRLRIIKNGKLGGPISGTPQPYRAYGNGGLMDIALDPGFKDNGWVYLTFHHSGGDLNDKNALRTVKVVRGKIESNTWVNEETLFQAPEDLRILGGSGRQGSRMVIDGNKKLYFSIGDMGYEDQCQEVSSTLGKLFRINLDGSIPKDNPFVNEPGAIRQIFTLGNRNIQGIAIHPVSKKIYASEHGPMGGDELNIIESGNNYGWPKVSFGIGYDGSKYTDLTEMEGMVNPVKQWTPSIAVCPIEFSSQSMFHKWENNLMVGALAYEELHRLVIENDMVIKSELLLKGYGRVRDVKFAPDGSLYVVLNKPDKILRLTPKR